jgi:hypothetical protein
VWSLNTCDVLWNLCSVESCYSCWTGWSM